MDSAGRYDGIERRDEDLTGRKRNRREWNESVVNYCIDGWNENKVHNHTTNNNSQTGCTSPVSRMKRMKVKGRRRE